MLPGSPLGSGGGGGGAATSIGGVDVSTSAPAGPFADNMPLVTRDVGGGVLRVVGSLELPVAGGGTGAATAADARTNLSAAQSGVATGASSSANTGSTSITFSGTVAAALVTLASGTGMTAAGVTMTSTDNQTATLNQYSGCMLATASANSMLYISASAACTGAPLALTVFGTPVTDAGEYRILGIPTPAGTIGSHTHTITHTHNQTG